MWFDNQYDGDELIGDGYDHRYRTQEAIGWSELELEDEFGKFTTKFGPGGYVTLINENGDAIAYAYMSDRHADARLRITDQIQRNPQ